MKTKTPRLTRAAVCDEVRQLRSRLTDLIEMSPERLKSEYAEKFPANAANCPGLTHTEMLHTLTMSATYYLSNVLALDD